MRDPRANYRQSLEVLRHVKRIQPNMVTKSSLMLGLGETDDEVLQAMKGITPFAVHLQKTNIHLCPNLFHFGQDTLINTNVTFICA